MEETSEADKLVEPLSGEGREPGTLGVHNQPERVTERLLAGDRLPGTPEGADANSPASQLPFLATVGQKRKHVNVA